MPARVLITRENAQPLADLLAEAGAVPVHVPMLLLEPTGAAPPHFAPDAVLVTSAAVLRFVPDLAGYIDGARVVAVGAQTGAALEAAGVQVSLVGTGGGVDAFDLLDLQPGEAGWYVGARRPSHSLDEAMGAGLARWTVYQTQVPPQAGTGLAEALPCDVLTFCSGSAVRGFASCGSPGDARVVTIGASTAEVAQSLGWTVHAVAKTADLGSLVEAALG